MKQNHVVSLFKQSKKQFFPCVKQCWVACRGLEQQVALPRDSYLQNYFTDLYDVLRVGPPLYFVVPHIHMDPQDTDINMICSVGGCNDTSFVNEVRWCDHSKCVVMLIYTQCVNQDSLSCVRFRASCQLCQSPQYSFRVNSSLPFKAMLCGLHHAMHQS